MMGLTPLLLRRAQEPRRGARAPRDNSLSIHSHHRGVRHVDGRELHDPRLPVEIECEGGARRGPDLLRFFALYYGALEGLSFITQIVSEPAMRRVKVGTAMSLLPGGVVAASLAALIVQGSPVVALARGVDSVVRTSLFRSPYELLFVAMDPSTRHRAKAMLDVICARAGDALGSGIVQDLQTLRDLRSRDPARVTAALARPAALGRIHVAQIIAMDPAAARL